MSLEVPYFSSPCQARKRKSWILVRYLSRRESVTKTAYQMIFINWFTKVTNDPIGQDLGTVNVVGVGSNEDCGNRLYLVVEVSVDVDPGHGMHLVYGGQAGRFEVWMICGGIGSR